jgi:hypothetical protein
MTDISIRTLLLEFVDANGASPIRELHIDILRHKPDPPEHTIRARLSEAVSDGLRDRLGDGCYDVYAEDEGRVPVRSPRRQVPALYEDKAVPGGSHWRLTATYCLYGDTVIFLLSMTTSCICQLFWIARLMKARRNRRITSTKTSLFAGPANT